MKHSCLIAIGLVLIFLSSPSREQTTVLIPGPNCINNFDKVYTGSLTALPGGLRLRGSTASTGNAMYSRKNFNLQNSEIYFTWRLNGSSSYAQYFLGVAAVIYPGIFTTGDYPPAPDPGKIPVSKNTNYYTRIAIHPDQTWSASTCTGNYDNSGGTHVFDTSGTIDPVLWKYVSVAKLETSIKVDNGYPDITLYEMKIMNGPEVNVLAQSCTSVYTFEDSIKPSEIICQCPWWVIVRYYYTTKMLRASGFNTTIDVSTTKNNVVKVGFDVVVDNSSGNLPWDEMQFLINDTVFRTCIPDWDHHHNHFEMMLPPGGTRTFKWKIIADNFYSVSISIDNIAFTYADSAAATATTLVNPVCEGTPVTFTSQTVSSGSPAQYQWFLNGNPAGGATGTSWSPGVLLENDQVWMIEHHHDQCPDTIYSDTVVMHTKPLPWTDLSLCQGTVYRDSRKFTLKGGLPAGGTWSGPGVLGSFFDPSLVPVGMNNARVIYQYTGANGCTDTTGATLPVLPAPAFTCGSIFTDPRDNHQYPTFSAGSRCWFSANLEHGINTAQGIHQQDNCFAEKYTATATGAGNSSLYQWDEIMNYETATGLQDICPHGWHVPGLAEWDELFTVYGGKAYAGDDLAQGGSSGFAGIFYGDLFMNNYPETYGDYTFFWTSDRSGNGKAFAHGIDDRSNGVTTYSSPINNAFTVRCVHN